MAAANGAPLGPDISMRDLEKWDGCKCSKSHIVRSERPLSPAAFSIILIRFSIA